MRFDASPAAQALVKRTIAVDPRAVRVGLVRIGGTLKEICKIEGKVEWSRAATKNARNAREEGLRRLR